MIPFRCDCGTTVQAPDHFAGRMGKCPKCGALSKIPLPGAADGLHEAGPPEISGQDSPMAAADPVLRTRPTWVCANCEQAAGRLEKPREWNGNIVCPTCYAKLQAASATPVPRVPPTAPSPPWPTSLGTPLRSESFAGFWKRAAAAIIDTIVLYIGGIICGFMTGIVLGASGADIDTIEVAAVLAGISCGWLYSALMESSRQQATLGKMVLRIKVTDLQGQRVSFGRATGRHFAKLLSGLILGVGFLMAGFTKRKQALHDSVADCLVVCKGC